jgi:hypothetical protein
MSVILVLKINTVNVHVLRHVSYSVPVPRHVSDFSFQNKCCFRARATSCLALKTTSSCKNPGTRRGPRGKEAEATPPADVVNGNWRIR